MGMDYSGQGGQGAISEDYHSNLDLEEEGADYGWSERKQFVQDHTVRKQHK